MEDIFGGVDYEMSKSEATPLELVNTSENTLLLFYKMRQKAPF